ncbi:MAG: hypothetical protein ABIT05_15845 [Chitinophagaceae bacterium]
MKNIFFFAILVCTGIVSFAQPANTGNLFPVKGQLVKVTDWGSRSIYILSGNFFLETKDSIVAQVGEQEFDEMKGKCSSGDWPKGLYKSDLSEEEDKAFDVLLNKLKMYRIAVYTHIYNGITFERYVILRVPYEENKNWDNSVQWEGNVYFLLKEKDVEFLKG